MFEWITNDEMIRVVLIAGTCVAGVLGVITTYVVTEDRLKTLGVLVL